MLNILLKKRAERFFLKKSGFEFPRAIPVCSLIWSQCERFKEANLGLTKLKRFSLLTYVYHHHHHYLALL
jgi:hypothetical protein